MSGQVSLAYLGILCGPRPNYWSDY